MCGRYCIDKDTVREIEKLVWEIEERLKRELAGIYMEAIDIHPANMAPVLTSGEKGIDCKWLRWGLPGIEGKQLIINARSESALSKRMFCESLKRRRIIVPASWFYEWSRNKEKNTFYNISRSVLYMAGFYDRYRDEDRFVILTTEANDSMRPVHDRMPLVLDKNEIRAWLSGDCHVESFLHKTPSVLDRQTEFEQMSLF